MELNSSVCKQDAKRLLPQLTRVAQHMLKSRWQTLAEISKATKAPEASVSARLREIRSAGYRVEKKRVIGGNGLYTYRVFK